MDFIPLRGTAWRKLILCFGATVFAALSASVWAAESARHGPSLAIEDGTFNAGTVPQGQPLRHDFRISNRGDQTLEITAVEPSCGCTTTGEWPHTLTPGASGAIPVMIDTTGFSGSVEKSIEIVSNDAVHPRLLLQVTADVWTPLHVTPAAMIFPALADPGSPVSRTAHIRNQTTEPVTLAEPVSDNPAFKPELKTITPGREYELIVATVPPLSDGTASGTITIHTSNHRMPELSIRAAVTVLPAVQIAPEAIVMPLQPLTRPQKRFALLIDNRGPPLEVSGVAVNAAAVQLTTDLSPDHKRAMITLTFPIGFSVHPTDKLYLRGRTNHPAAPAFQIPIISTP
jgi:hypothetical protein